MSENLVASTLAYVETLFLIVDESVCKEFWLWLNTIGDTRFKAVLKTYKVQKGAHPREFFYKGGTTSGLKFEDSKQIVKFLTHVAEIHSLALPGRVPG